MGVVIYQASGLHWEKLGTLPGSKENWEGSLNSSKTLVLPLSF